MLYIQFLQRSLLAAACCASLSCAGERSGAPAAAPSPSRPTTAAVQKESKQDGVAGKHVPLKRDPRKIVYRGELRVVVKAYTPAKDAIDAMIAHNGGYISSSQVEHRVGRVSSATLVLRIPAGQFADILKRIGNLGILVRESTAADDITEQYFDLNARLGNAKKLEARLLELVAKEAGKVAELLKVEQELARVRGTIEVMTGKLRLYDQQVAFSTLTVRLDIREKYVPPKPPTFGGKAGRILSDSVDALASFGEGLLLVLIALVPWLPVILAFIFVVSYLVRRRRRKRGL